MKTIYSLSSFKFMCIFFLFGTVLSHSQADSEIVDAYEDYTDAFREVVYMHLNKSTYIKGESIGFTAYVIDKKDKKPSLLTTNLYVSIEDENRKVIEQKLIRVNKGVASNAIELDSLYTSGYYKIKAYTNWMRNFNEQNHFVETIKIIDPETQKYIVDKIVDQDIDAQFLPESGHLLNNIVNTIGVVLKDNQGYGIAYAKGEIIDKNNEILSSFETNQFGIGRFPLLGKADNRYKINISNGNKNSSFNLTEKIEKKGVVLSVKRLKTKVFVSVITNEETLELIKNKRYTLMVHNGDAYEIMDIYFNDDTIVTKIIESTNVPKGINILTLFNDSDQPIAERLFFNYKGIEILNSDRVTTVQKNDSLTVSINYKHLDAKNFNNISVSVLPQETESYNRHHNMVSYTYLQPYLKGIIENGKYYFSDINEKKQHELDNLLITQGWSSYNWNTIFKNEYNKIFPFEQGLTLNANVNVEQKVSPTSYLLHGTKNQEPLFIDILENKNTFSLSNVFFSENDKVLISEVKKNSGLKPAKLYVQSFPSTIPVIANYIEILKPKTKYKIETRLNESILLDDFKNTQRLKEVIINAQYERKRLRTEELKKSSWGKIYVIDEDERIRFNTLTQFINSRTLLRAFDNDSLGLVAINPSPTTINNNSSVTFYLNGIPLNNNNILYKYPMFNIDYIEVNKSGVGEGIRGGNGVIKIYTNPDRVNERNNKNTSQEYILSLVFSKEKKFYAPKYRDYNSEFYKSYGTINWIPELLTDSNGTIRVRIANPKVPITLFIEGISNDGSFVIEEKSISLN